jgi:hypothetical protein
MRLELSIAPLAHHGFSLYTAALRLKYDAQHPVVGASSTLPAPDLPKFSETIKNFFII